MPSKYWIKLYHEILHDPKMGQLPDNLWRRAIELFLLAGETEDEGALPPTSDIAWTLRLDQSQLEQEMLELAKVDILTETEDGWLVTHFAARQEARTGAQRAKRYRERKRSAQYYGNETRNETVTNRYTDVEVDKEEDRDKEVEVDADIPKNGDGDKNQPAAADPAKETAWNAWCECHPMQVNSMDADEFEALCQEYKPEWIGEAIKEANRSKQSRLISWNFVNAILSRWEREGFKAPRGPMPDKIPKAFAGLQELIGEDSDDA